jgi:hypothetical protein
MDFSFLNGIVDGSLQSGNELEVSSLPDAQFNWVFKNSLLKIDNPDINIEDATHFVNMRFNEDPGFADVSNRNYKLSATSVARNWGVPEHVNAAPAIPTDILEANRLADEAPDAGAYEFIP